MPGEQERIDLVDNVGKRQRPAGENHGDQRLAGRAHLADQFGLVAGQADVGTRVGLAGEDCLFAEKQQCHIGGQGGFYGFIECRPGRAA